MIPDMPPHSYTCLAEAVQTEALRNTDDEYGVVASILNRVASPDFPDTVCSVVYSKGQYEGVYKNPNLKADPELVEDAESIRKEFKEWLDSGVKEHNIYSLEYIGEGSDY